MQEDRIQPTTPRSFSETDGIETEYTSSALAPKSDLAMPENALVWIRGGLAVVMGLIGILWLVFWVTALSGKWDRDAEKKKEMTTIQNTYYYTSVNNKLIDFYTREKATSILDLECGKCPYAKNIKIAGFEVQAFDGNPYSEELTDGFVKFADFSRVQDLRTMHDWVQSLEIESHVPEEQLKTFLGNMARHARKGIILSWSVYRQKSKSPEDSVRINQNVIDIMRPREFEYDEKTTMEFRNLPNADDLRDGFMVFRLPEI